MHHTPINIMLIEDNEDDIFITKRIFKKFGLVNEIEVINNSEKIIPRLKRESGYEDMALPDLILLDINMPRMDGHDVLKIIREDSAFENTAVIMLSGSTAQEDILKTYELQANGYIGKPISLEKIFEILKNLNKFGISIIHKPSE